MSAVFLIAVVAALALPAAAHADTVTSWHDDVSVAQSGAVTVRETIVYDPQDGTHHGIVRDVPAVFGDADGHSYYTTLDLKSVTDEHGASYPLAEKSVTRRGLYLKVGASDTLISPGPHTYVISYAITPLVVQASAGDRLLLNIIGNSWTTAVQSASATITLPTGLGNTPGLDCFTGAAGSTQSSCTIAPSGAGVVRLATTRSLSAGDAFTADITAAHQHLAAYLRPDVRPPLTPLEILAIALAVIAVVVTLAGLVVLAFRAWRAAAVLRSQTIIPQYEAPAGLSPAHMSILESPASDVADITAILIHLAIRGHLKIEQTRVKTIWRKAGYRLTRLTSTGKLAEFENGLLVAIFKDDSEINLDVIARSRPGLSTSITAMRSTIGAELTSKGYFLSSPTNWLVAGRILTALLAISAVIIVAVTLINDTAATALAFACVAGAAAGVSLYLDLRPSGRTQTGNAAWAHIRGFKWFLEVTEKTAQLF
jgi:hypothetical protein